MDHKEIAALNESHKLPENSDQVPEHDTAIVHLRRPPGIIRRMYNWVLSWAETPYGTPALAIISFAESSFFPIPPDVLQIALSVSRPKRSFWYAGVSAVASVLGGIFGWLIGYALWESLGWIFLGGYVPGFSQKEVDYVGELYRTNAFWSILAAAFTPIPYKVFTVSAGIFHAYVPLSTLIIASVIGRSARFFLVATTIYFIGPKVRSLLEKRLELITIVLFVLVVLGFFAIKWLV
jgi:membrane protein YqaA with SNARE-associated domain